LSDTPFARYYPAMSEPANTRSVTFPRGFLAVGGTCRTKPSGHPDLAIIAAEHPCTAAGVFTTNKLPGEPVKVSKRHVRNGIAQAIVCYSGSANVATGKTGRENALAMCRTVGDAIGCTMNDVLVCSTGVIGVQLPMEKITAGIQMLSPELSRGAKADAAAAKAILTTDLVTKSETATVQLGSRDVRLGGIAKGSGMIAPNMATMLAFITTDAAIDAALLQQALRDAVNESFNRITVDSDTSTSDSVLVLASGEAKNRPIRRTGRHFDTFRATLRAVCHRLALKVLRDGEGVTKVFTVKVTGAAGAADADRVGRSIANSPLVKTAVHGGDPNWGRLVMAVGKSGARVKPDMLSIAIEGTRLFEMGQPVPLADGTMRNLEHAMKRERLTIEVDLGIDDGAAEWWGCDLSKQYVTINADYTT